MENSNYLIEKFKEDKKCKINKSYPHPWGDCDENYICQGYKNRNYLGNCKFKKNYWALKAYNDFKDKKRSYDIIMKKPWKDRKEKYMRMRIINNLKNRQKKYKTHMLANTKNLKFFPGPSTKCRQYDRKMKGPFSMFLKKAKQQTISRDTIIDKEKGHPNENTWNILEDNYKSKLSYLNSQENEKKNMGVGY